MTGRSSYSLRAAYQKTWINSLGGELLLSGELGTKTGVSAEIHQPLDPAQTYFVAAQGSLRNENFSLFNNDLRVSDYRDTVKRIDLSVGRSFGLIGQVRLGWREEQHTYGIETGIPLLRSDQFGVSGVQASLELDQKKQLHVSSQGWSARASWFEAANGSHNMLGFGLDGSMLLGDWVLGVRSSYAGSTYGELPGQQVAKLGGFLNLSGFATEQLSGDKVSYAHVRAERILGQMPMGLRGDLRAGFALEAGRIGRPLSEPLRTGVLDSAVIYVCTETPIGPAYIGLARSSSGPVNAYLFIGTP